jgi:hypothetical protein
MPETYPINVTDLWLALSSAPANLPLYVKFGDERCAVTGIELSGGPMGGIKIEVDFDRLEYEKLNDFEQKWKFVEQNVSDLRKALTELEESTVADFGEKFAKLRDVIAEFPGPE